MAINLSKSYTRTELDNEFGLGWDRIRAMETELGRGPYKGVNVLSHLYRHGDSAGLKSVGYDSPRTAGSIVDVFLRRADRKAGIIPEPEEIA